MTSKEKLLNILKDYKLADKGNGDFLSNKYQEELLNPILKDLEEKEKQDKILEEMREHIEAIDYGEKCTYRYYVIIDGNRFDCSKETYDMWSRWLNNGK